MRAFAGFSAALLRDRSISWCAVSVLTYLLALPNDARVSLRTLPARRPEGREGVAAALRELEERRYLRRMGGLPVLYEVFDAPYEAEPPRDETEKVRERHAPGRRTVQAAHLLISLGQIDPRLTLDADEALRLAPLVEQWWRRGASSAEVRAALAYGWPGSVHSAPAQLEERLRRARPRRPTALPVTDVEVEARRPGVLACWDAMRRGGAFVRALLGARLKLA
ncbi:MAG: hypothetical protein HOY79_28615 [Streptomyces sp.]|nr:hypothetical protein [Streptomyces sp.]